MILIKFSAFLLLKGWGSVTIYKTVVCHYLQRFLVTDPKIFLKAPLASKYTNIEEGTRAEKTHFFSKFFKKCLKLTFSACLFKIMPAAQKFFGQSSDFLVLWQSLKN